MTRISPIRHRSRITGKLSNVLGNPLLAATIIPLCLCFSTRCLAQPTPTLNVSGGVVVVEGQPQPDGQAKPSKPGPDSKGKPPTTSKDGEPPKEGSSAEKKNDGAAEPVKRTSEPPAPPNKKELEIKPDEQGRVQFQFRNQAWPDVLRWLAEASSMSLDWQELPGDYLNLATQRPFEIGETRDLINRHLLARGFTMLEIDSFILVTKTENINTALVPKVTVDQLKSLPPNRYVRTSFTLDTLIAEEVIDEFKQLISANGKLIPLNSTNRLEAMDAAGNLQELNRILLEEQSDKALAELAREFPLQHIRASEAKTMLELFIGLQKSSSGSSESSSSRQMQMMQEMMQQQQQMMQQQNRGGDKSATDKTKKRPSDVYVVANQRLNSLIVHAQPDKMAIVAAFIARIDVRNENAETFQSMQRRMQIYRLASISPKQLVASLLAMDALEPTTTLEVDEANNSIIAHASIVDQFTIQTVIERLDGSARKFQMMQLRRLRADEVAGTIKFLMGAEQEKKDDSSSRRNYGYYDPYSSRGDDKKKSDDKFRVGANVADNQLLLWCNETENKEVLNLLTKLGELPPEGSRPNPFRTIDATRSPETLEYLKKLQEKWRAISPNPLKLPSPQDVAPPDESKLDNDSTGKPKTTPTTFHSDEQFERFVATVNNPEAIAESEGTTEAKTSDSDNPPPDKPQAPNRPIEVRFDADGNLLLLSEDTEALDQLELLMLRDAPPKRAYDVFQVKNTRASWISLQLEDYFKEDSKQKSESRITYYVFDGSPSEQKKEDPQLGSRRQLKFIYDIDTNTIVVIGANDSQRKTIAELIQLWDTEDPKKSKDARYQKLVPVRYSRAEAIEQAIKDVYRDFLSENDKTFDKTSENGKKGEEKRDRSLSTRKFSLGVDKITNILIVSAEGEDFLKVLCDLIEQLDQAARPSGSLEVVPFQAGSGSAKSMEKAFKALVEAAKQPPPNNKQQRGQQNGDGNQNGGNSDQ
jgi:type II secretory pathway component GspD/PulD (secretin)